MPSTPEGTKSLSVRGIPEELMRKFKALCASLGVPIQEKIIEIMTRAVREAKL